jgi:hypothetical protein
MMMMMVVVVVVVMIVRSLLSDCGGLELLAMAFV